MTFPILASLLVRLVVLLPFQLLRLDRKSGSAGMPNRSSRSEERFSRNAETDLVCRLLLEKKNNQQIPRYPRMLRTAKLPTPRSTEAPDADGRNAAVTSCHFFHRL